MEEEDEYSLAELEPESTFNELADVVQLLVQNEQPWTIHVSNELGLKGVVGTAPGKVCYARVGETRGAEAFYMMMSWSRGHIDRRTHAAQPDEIDTDLATLLMEAYWYSVEHAKPSQSLVKTLERESPLVVMERVFDASPSLRRKVEEVVNLEGFVSLSVNVGMMPSLTLGEPLRQQEVEFYEALKQTWASLGGDAVDAVARLNGQIHIVRRVEGDRDVDVHIVLNRRLVTFAITLFRIRNIFEKG